jgi:hypothetical protein
MANRVLLGEDGSDYVLKVSKPGVNVLTADDEELIFDSTKPEGSMILASGSTSITFSSIPYTSSWVNFPETYSFEPVVLLSRDLGSNSIRNMPETELGNEGSGDAKTPTFRFTTNLRVSVETQTSRFRIHIGQVGGNTAGARPRLLTGTHTFYYLVLNIGGATSS